MKPSPTPSRPAPDRRASSIPRKRDDCSEQRAPDEVAPVEVPKGESAGIRRRLITAAILATSVLTIVLAVPPLRGVAHQIGHMNPIWVLVAVGLEVASCASYVVIFRLFFDELPARPATELAWTEQASGALLPTGGVGALAIGGWMLSQAGMSKDRVIERSSALFFLTSAMNVTALIVGGVMLATGDFGGTDSIALVAIPLTLGIVSTSVTLAIPVVLRRMPGVHPPALVAGIVDGIDGARHTLVRPHWRMLGAFGYLGFDIAVLGAAMAATGHPIPVDALVLGYVLGYMANMLPVPGGFGVLEAGLAGMLVAYGAPITEAAAATVVYHAIAFWIPSLGGLFGYSRLRRRSSLVSVRALRRSPGATAPRLRGSTASTAGSRRPRTAAG